MNIDEIDNSVKDFYKKNANENYKDEYHKQHLPRYVSTVSRFQLGSLHNKKIGDFGGGRGGFLKLLPQDNEFFIYDGADLKQEDMYIDKVNYNQLDLDRDCKLPRVLDTSFCFETVEHVASPFRILNNIKDATQINGDVYISIPDERMTHPVIYYTLFYPHYNFIDFLECMALPVMDQYIFDNGWPSWIYKCKNVEWKNKKMKFYKHEQKFRDANLLECTNF